MCHIATAILADRFVHVLVILIKLGYPKAAAMTYLLSVAGEGFPQLGSTRHGYHCVLNVVCLEQRLQDFARTQRVHVRVGQH